MVLYIRAGVANACIIAHTHPNLQSYRSHEAPYPPIRKKPQTRTMLQAYSIQSLVSSTRSFAELVSRGSYAGTWLFLCLFFPWTSPSQRVSDICEGDQETPCMSDGQQTIIPVLRIVDRVHVC